MLNAVLNVMYFNELATDTLYERKDTCTYHDFIEMTRFVAGACYGCLAPLVLRDWGVTHDREIIRYFYDNNEGLFDEVVHDSLAAGLETDGKRVLEPLDIDDCELYEYLFEVSD